MVEYKPSEWYDLWSHPIFIEYKSIIQAYRMPSIRVDATISLNVGNKVYTIVPPIYGDVHASLDNEKDPAKRIDIINYIALMKKDQLQHDDDITPITFIKRLPEVQQEDAVSESKPKPKPKPKAKPKIKEKPNEEANKNTYKDKSPKINNNSPNRSRSSPASLEKILSRSLGAKLPFTKPSECKSSARTAKYYISKAALVELIKSDARLLEKVGKKYATLTKEQICEKLFT